MRKHLRLIVVVGAFLALTWGVAVAWDYDKNKEHPDGAKAVKELKKDGDYYVVKGADMHNIGADLIGEKIRFQGYAREIKRFPSKTLLFLSEDRCYFVILHWGSLGKIPEDLRKRIENNGVRPAGGFFNRYEGDKLTLYCTVDSLMPEAGLNKSILSYKSCIVKSVDKWEKDWVGDKKAKEKSEKGG